MRVLGLMLAALATSSFAFAWTPQSYAPPCKTLSSQFYIFFKSGSEVGAAAQKFLDKTFLPDQIHTSCEIKAIVLEGFAGRDDDATNHLALSLRRSAGVREALIDRGAARSIISTRGFGLRTLIKDDAYNRIVKIEVVSGTKQQAPPP